MTKELGDFKSDFEEWFLMWDSVLFYPNPMDKNVVIHSHAGEGGVIPCHQHRACKGLVKVESPFPPRICPGCGVDSKLEFQNLPEETRNEWLQSL